MVADVDDGVRGSAHAGDRRRRLDRGPRGIRNLLAGSGRDVIAELDRVDGLMAQVRRDQPDDAVVLDIRIPPTHRDEGLRAAEQVRGAHPDVAVLDAIAVCRPRVREPPARRWGAQSRLSARDRLLDGRHLSDALRRLVARGTVIDPELVSHLMRAQVRRRPLAGLTERELTVRCADGRRSVRPWHRRANALSTNTIRTHVQHIFDKLAISGAIRTTGAFRAVLNFLHHGGRSRRPAT